MAQMSLTVVRVLHHGAKQTSFSVEVDGAYLIMLVVMANETAVMAQTKLHALLRQLRLLNHHLYRQRIFSNVLMAITLTTTYAAMEEEIVMTAVMKYSAQAPTQ